jgi:hypothetical protein
MEICITTLSSMKYSIRTLFKITLSIAHKIKSVGTMALDEIILNIMAQHNVTQYKGTSHNNTTAFLHSVQRQSA